METLKDKKVPSLDEQIKFVHDARKLLESNPDVEIRWYADSADKLLAVEENLIALKLLKNPTLNIHSLIGQLYVINSEVIDSQVISKQITEVLLKVVNSAEYVDTVLQRFPIDTEVLIEIGAKGKAEWVQGHVHHYENGKPVVIAYFGKTFVISDPTKIKGMEGEDHG